MLGPFEYQVLATLQAEPNDAYGVTIRSRMSARTGKTPSIGALYTTLDRLVEKGFAKSRWGEATAARGGRRKRFYEISADGVRAIRHTQAAYRGPDELALPEGALA